MGTAVVEARQLTDSGYLLAIGPLKSQIWKQSNPHYNLT